jgi:adenine-specific DNA-methyltransferase
VADNSLKKGRYTKYSNKIGLYSNSKGSFIKNDTSVVLSFPFKDTVLEAGMSKEEIGREERFLHLEMDSKDIDTLEELKVLTHFRYIDKDGEKALTASSDIEFFDADGHLKQNLLIKGNNLLALCTLRERLAGQVKLIYIDPPYNTGNDSFKYNDRFNHSAWLVFMKNRLEVAKDLLTKDGLIFVQCDHKEDAYLRVLMDEIFSQSNLVAQITVKSNSISGNKTQHKEKTILKNKDTLLVYKIAEEIIVKPQYVEKQEWDTHYNSILRQVESGEYEILSLKDELVSEGIISNKDAIKSDAIKNDKFAKWVFENRNNIFRKVNSIPDNLRALSLKNPDKVVSIQNEAGKRMYAHGGKRLSMLSKVYHEIDGQYKLAQLLGDLWTDIDFQNTQNEGGVDLTSGKKPEALIRRIVDMATRSNDIVLDFFVGSGTTAAVAHKMNRRWIGIEQMDYVEDKTIIRLKRVIQGEQNGISRHVGWQGSGSFVYFELKKYNQYFIDKINAASSKGELDKVYDEMAKNAFLKFWFDKKHFEKEENFRSLSLDERKRKLIEILDENHLYLNYADMNDMRHQVTADEKALTDKFYGATEN